MAETLMLTPSHYSTIRKPALVPRQTKRILERRYDFALTNKVTSGGRAAMCSQILTTAQEEGVTLDEAVRVGCRFWLRLELLGAAREEL